MGDRDRDGFPMIFKDKPVRPVWRQWFCDCGGEIRHSETLTFGYRKEHHHYCDKCFTPRIADETYPRISYIDEISE